MSKPTSGTFTLYYHGVPSEPIDHDAEPGVISSIVNELIERVSAYEREAEEAEINRAYQAWAYTNHDPGMYVAWSAGVAWQKSRHPEEDWEVEDE